MLFDLRGRGRRRTVQGIYLSLALLIGGGAIFFGIGGSGIGLFNSDNSNGSGGGGGLSSQIAKAEKRVQTSPKDPAGWGQLVRLHFNDASTESGTSTSGTVAYTPEGQARLRKAADAWRRYIALNPPKPDPVVANFAAQALGAMNNAAEETGALEIVAQARPSPGAYVRLACVAYAAKQSRKAELAASAAIARAPKAARKNFRAQLKQYKTAAVTQGPSFCG